MIRLALALILFAAPALAGTPAKVLSTLDGDTIRVRAELIPNIWFEGAVRLRGLDAPELKGKCDAERTKAREAKNALAQLVNGGVILHDISKDKYGRMLARVEAGGQDVAARMIGLGLAREYNGRSARKGWC